MIHDHLPSSWKEKKTIAFSWYNYWKNILSLFRNIYCANSRNEWERSNRFPRRNNTNKRVIIEFWKMTLWFKLVTLLIYDRYSVCRYWFRKNIMYHDIWHVYNKKMDLEEFEKTVKKSKFSKVEKMNTNIKNDDWGYKYTM